MKRKNAPRTSESIVTWETVEDFARLKIQGLFLDEVPPVYVPGADVRSWRQMIGHRQRLARERARAKNVIRATLRSHGLVAPRGLWGRQGMEWIETVELPTERDALQRDMLVERLRSVKEMIARVEAALDQVANHEPSSRRAAGWDDPGRRYPDRGSSGGVDRRPGSVRTTAGRW